MLTATKKKTIEELRLMGCITLFCFPYVTINDLNIAQGMLSRYVTCPLSKVQLALPGVPSSTLLCKGMLK